MTFILLIFRVEKKLSRVTEFQFFAKIVNLMGFPIYTVVQKEDKQIHRSSEKETDSDEEADEEEAMEDEEDEQEDMHVEASEEWKETITHLQSTYQEICHFEDVAGTDSNSDSALQASSDRLRVLFKCLKIMLDEDVYQVCYFALCVCVCVCVYFLCVCVCVVPPF